MKRARIISVIGARPQFIKAATVSRALAACGDIKEVLVHTGQHFDPEMSDIFFRELGMSKPDYHLDINRGGHGVMTGRMMEALEPIVLDERPDAVLVYGDTNSTLAGALVATKLHVPVAHVEAGLRSFNRAMPEEINRVVTDHVSSLLFCPTKTAVENLKREGVTRDVHNVGDVMYDATLFAAERARTQSRILERLGLEEGTYAVATIHRAENTNDPDCLSRVLGFVRENAGARTVVLPVHPRTAKAVSENKLSFKHMKTIPPLGYIDMHRLLQSAAIVYTDSGGVQKEAYFHRVPCITLRDETEWVETVENGWNRLWRGAGYKPRRDIHEYGDGHAAERIAELLSGWLDGTRHQGSDPSISPGRNERHA